MLRIRVNRLSRRGLILARNFRLLLFRLLIFHSTVLPLQFSVNVSLSVFFYIRTLYLHNFTYYFCYFSFRTLTCPVCIPTALSRCPSLPCVLPPSAHFRVSPVARIAARNFNLLFASRGLVARCFLGGAWDYCDLQTHSQLLLGPVHQSADSFARSKILPRAK